MPKKLFKWLIASLVVLGGLVLFGQWLLGSKIGRDLLEQQLEDVIGLRVRLGEEFGVRFLPAPGVRGNEIAISSLEGEEIVSTRSYLARVSLWPLLKGEVEVLALELEQIEIPFGSEGTIGFERLTLARNPAVAPLLVNAVGNLLDEDGEYVHMVLVANLDLSSPGTVALAVNSLNLVASGLKFNGIQGNITAQVEPLTISLEMIWDDLLGLVTLDTDLALDRTRAESESSLDITQLELNVGGYLFEGEGCFKPVNEGELHLRLNAPNIDLDALTRLAETLPGLAGAELGAKPAAPGKEAAYVLPFDAFLRLEVSQATYQGATARGVVFRAGGVPDCPGFG